MSAKLYGADLARIHSEGYSFHCEGAAPAILKWLRDSGIRNGNIVDLGCGGGLWLACLADQGHRPIGVDVSRAMIQLSRKIAPTAMLICGSCAEVDLPPCDAVTALGEPLNYLPNKSSFRRTIANVYRSLRPGGLFICDVRLPTSKPVEARNVVRSSKDWACIATIEEDHVKHRLTRRITTFTRRGRSYRRSEETHILSLYSKSQLMAWLRATGFRARAFRGYGEYKLGPRQIAIVARKSPRGSVC